MLSTTRQGRSFKSQPKSRQLQLNKTSMVMKNSQKSGIDLKYSSGDLIDNLHNQNHLVLHKKNSLSRKQVLAQIRVRPTFDPLEADFTQTVKIPYRANKIDSQQSVPFEVSIHDTPMEFLIKAQSKESAEEFYEIKITGDKNLKKMRS